MDKNNLNSSDYTFKRDYKKSGAQTRHGKKQKRANARRNVWRTVAMLSLFVAVFFTVNLLLDLSDLPTTITDTTQAGGNNGGVTPTNPEETTTAPVVQSDALSLKAMVINDKLLSNNPSVETYIAEAKELGVTAAVIDFKRANGTLAYTSSNELAKTNGANGSTIANLQSAITLLKENGFTIIARVECFRDPLLSEKKRELAVHYKGTTDLWYNNRPEAGGKTWLNPYSVEAQNYLLSLLGEVVTLGADRILLEGVQFPDGFSLELTTFQGESEGDTRFNTLVAFLEKASGVIGGKEKVIVGMSGDGALNGSTTSYDGNLLNSGMPVAAPDVRVANLPDIMELGGEKISPKSDTKKLFEKLPKQLVARAKLGLETPVTLMPTLSSENLSREEVVAYIKALETAGITGFILQP